MKTKINERTWAGQLVGWIKDAITSGTTIFQDATNDQGIKGEAKTTKFPDILLFVDKTSGVIFNGWELKFPDTPVDDPNMLFNALEKAKILRSDSFVTWNGAEAMIWRIPDDNYTSIHLLEKLKYYPKVAGINSRADLEDYGSYQKHEHALKSRLRDILADLQSLSERGTIKAALTISETFIEAVKDTSLVVIPQLQGAIKHLKGSDRSFREQFNRWTVYERSTLDMLASSSRKNIVLDEEAVLAKFTFYNLIGKIIFYETLASNMPTHLRGFDVAAPDGLKAVLEAYFESAKAIDYQAVFQPYFTDIIPFSPVIEKALFDLLRVISQFSLRLLPSEVIGTVLENLVPQDEKIKFGQYFTPHQLTVFAAFPAIRSAQDVVFDPTSGTGTFLSTAYSILRYWGNTEHRALLDQIWGNDISHFPAILSVINLYKQKPNETTNFPKVIRDDFFNLSVGKTIDFPEAKDFTQKFGLSVPMFDSIVSNFPFVQQEDIPDDAFLRFKQQIEKEQQAARADRSFRLNKRADYFTYCIYHATKFLKDDGMLAAITSNAWLGKEYGIQFKKFLLDNFTIKYVIQSEAEHWFKSSRVITIITVLAHGKTYAPTRFVTLNRKLEQLVSSVDEQVQIRDVEKFYADVDLCDDPNNKQWSAVVEMSNVYFRKDGSASVCIVPKERLVASLPVQENWRFFFESPDLLAAFEPYFVKDINQITISGRGERTGWNNMFIIPKDAAATTGIETDFLLPLIKGPKELPRIALNKKDFKNYLFVCQEPIENIQAQYPGAYKWIRKFEDMPNKNGKNTISEACAQTNKPFWYSMRPKMFHLVTSINPEERFFFTFSKDGFVVDQRLVALQVNADYDSELIAALLNCTLTYLWIEMNGTARYDGVLDLNANDFKKLKLLDPTRLGASQVAKIKKAFEPLKYRNVLGISDEVKKPDRIAFDKTIFHAFGLDEALISMVYRVLTKSVKNRIEMTNR